MARFLRSEPRQPLFRRQPLGGATSYTLTAEVGAFTLTGTATGLTAQRKLSVSAASFTLTGVAAGLTAQRNLSATVGAFTLAGTATGLSAQRKLGTTVGAFVLTGIDAGLNKGFSLSVSAGAFVVTGNATGLTAQRKLSTTVGAFTLSGIDVGLNKGFTLAAGTGAYTLTGVASGLLAARKLGVTVGAFTLAGQDVTLNKGFTLGAAAGTFTLTGVDTGLLLGRVLALSAGAFTLTGQDVSLTYTPGTDLEQIVADYLRISYGHHYAALGYRNDRQSYDAQAELLLASNYRTLAHDADPGMTAAAWGEERVSDAVMTQFYTDTILVGGQAGSQSVADQLLESMKYHELGLKARGEPTTVTAKRLLTLAYNLRVAADAADPLHETPEWALSDHDALMAFYAAYLGV